MTAPRDVSMAQKSGLKPLADAIFAIGKLRPIKDPDIRSSREASNFCGDCWAPSISGHLRSAASGVGDC